MSREDEIRNAIEHFDTNLSCDDVCILNELNAELKGILDERERLRAELIGYFATTISPDGLLHLNGDDINGLFKEVFGD